MKKLVVILTAIFICTGIEKARCQYFSLSQQSMLTSGKQRNPKVKPAKKEKRRIQKRLDKAKAQEQFIVTGAGNIELAKEKLANRKNRTGSSINYTSVRTKPQNSIFKSPPPRSAFRKNYYRSVSRKGRND